MPPLAPRLPLHRLAHCRFAPRIRRALPSCESAPHIPRICHVDLCRARPPCMATTPAEGPQIRVNLLHVRLARSAHTVPTIHVPTLPWASARIDISSRIICARHMAHIVRRVPSMHTTLRRRTHLRSVPLAPCTARALPVLPPCSFASHLLQPTLRRMRDHLRGLRESRSCALTVPAPSPTFLHPRLYVRLVQPQPRPVVPTPTDSNEVVFFSLRADSRRITSSIYRAYEMARRTSSTKAQYVLALTIPQDRRVAAYVPLLQRAVLSRLLSQLAQVYASVRISFIMELVASLREAAATPPKGEASAEKTEELPKAEKRTFDPSRSNPTSGAVRVDHANGSIAFVDDPFGDHDHFNVAEKKGAEAAVQPSIAELVRTRLGSVARCLHNSLEVISPPPVPSDEDGRAQLAVLLPAIHEERKALQLRRALVARRRELLSELSVQKEKEEVLKRADASWREKEEGARRAKEDARKRELERIHKIRVEIEQQNTERYKAALVEKGILKPGDHEKIASHDTEGLIGLQVAQLEKEKKEVNERLHIGAKRVDHIERTYREERPLLAHDYDQQHAVETFTDVQSARKETARKAHEADLETKQWLARMMSEYETRRAVVLVKKGEEYAKKNDAASRKIEEEKAKRRKAVSPKREERLAIEEAKRREQERIEEEHRLEEERLTEEDRIRAEELLPPRPEEPPKDDDGFQTVPEQKGAWRPKRGHA
ncbi:hypothetical protein B0H16DRAFT_1738701 [Mycena metata]|uniref:Uncharacterized protein n=1 Tax=Mycena metata TaxID=1033252 RepID=A0AAD7HH91_9AGAR|nr:hypothetical protein B0H16DRAFT_1738701 [Mycena metata]